MMRIEWISFAFGVLLLFVAIVGGGFELRELKVPRVGRVARAVSAVAGLCFLGLGIPALATADPPRPPPSAEAMTIDFTIHDQLDDDQVTEQVAVHVDGRMVGTLTVDVAHPHSELTVTVPKPGQYSYTLTSRTLFDINGQPVEVPGSGSGHVDVTAGTSLAIRYDIGDTELRLWLE
jgi:hypothetical protein